MIQKKSNSVLLWVLVVSVTLTFGLVNTANALDIVRDGKPVATIVIAPDAKKSLKDATEVLRDCLEKSSGARLNIATTAPQTGNIIYIGIGPWVEAFKIKQKDLGKEGFEILFPDVRSMLILGPTHWGAEFGIYEFLERYVGVRWLIPGPDGTHIPKHETINLPAVKIRQKPAFLMRLYSGLNEEQHVWLRANRTSCRKYHSIGFHHNLRNLVPYTVYGVKHPEIYPLIDGKRYKGGDPNAAQLCFSSQDSIDLVAKNIIERFDKNPNLLFRSTSLGINDGSDTSWCQCKACKAQYSGKKNSIGMSDYSDIYYKWCSKVIDIVLKKYPDAWFGCLAYNNVFDPPSTVKMHPRLVPFICMDRMQWADAKQREDGHAFQKNWLNHFSTLGWYDYVYGNSYKVPRVYFHRMAENYRYAKKNGVKFCYAEAYPANDRNWGEGPKLYVASKFLWNPDIDIDVLLRDWYVCFAGKDAADDIAKYYQHWEDFWTQRVLKTSWFGCADSQNYKQKTYLNFNSNEYLDIITFEEMALCRRLLESALSKTLTKAQHTRVQLLLNAFEKSETAVFINHINNAVSPQKIITAILQSDSGKSLKLKAKKLQYIYQRRAKLASRNPSFEMGSGSRPDHWLLWVKSFQGKLVGVVEWIKDSAKAHTGKKCIMVKGVKRGGPAQKMKIGPGQYVLSFYYKTPGLSEGRAPSEVQINVNLEDAKRKVISRESFSVKPTIGKWQMAVLFIDVPLKIGNSVVAAQISLVTNHMPPEEEIYYDDIAIYRLP